MVASNDHFNLLTSGRPFHILSLLRQGASLKERLAAHPVLMAPMAGVSDGVYRTMARAAWSSACILRNGFCRRNYGGEKTWELVEPFQLSQILLFNFLVQSQQFMLAAAQISERLGNKLAL